MQTPKYKFVECRWLDAYSTGDWHTIDKLPKPALVVTRGWKVKQTKLYVVIAGTFAESTGENDPMQFGECIAIPTNMIKSIETLEI